MRADVIYGKPFSDQESYKWAGTLFGIWLYDNQPRAWLLSNNATTNYDLSIADHDFTGVAIVSSDIINKGFVWSTSFDGATKYYYCNDHADFTFLDDGFSATGFVIAGWIQVTDTASIQVIASKWNEATGAEAREWRLSLTALEKLKFEIYDETNNVVSYSQSDAGLSVGWHSIISSYNCAGGATALNGSNYIMYVDGATIAETPVNDGSYVQMRDTTAKCYIGTNLSTASAVENCFAGDIATGFNILGVTLSSTDIFYMYLYDKAFINP